VLFGAEFRTGVVKDSSGHRYPWSCAVFDRNTLIFNGGQRRPCFVLLIRPESREAVIETIERSGSCSLNVGAETRGAGEAAFRLAHDRGV